ncbi:MAG: RNA methyltransferase, partial [Synechococcaceae cyanobacterium SM2_3_60]|nr:RNA methyltransferase [Synechococcaceae cyanobacterium SM2_3_60]
QEVLDTALIVPSLPEALKDVQRVMGTVGRLDVPEIRPDSPRTALPWLLAVKSAALVFGPEDRGLSNAELGLCQRWLTIPVSPAIHR